jgi:hypothetical protein
MAVVIADALPSNPLDALRDLTAGEAELDRLRRESVRAARIAGASWDEIGAALGMTRQSAWEYFSRETRTSLARNVEANADLTEHEATELAVDETRAVRRSRRAL